MTDVPLSRDARAGAWRVLLLGLWPPLVISAVLAGTGDVWLAFAVYHVGCLAVPRTSPRRAGLVAGDWRSWTPVALSLAVVLAAANLALVAWLGDGGHLAPAGMRALARIEPWALFGLHVLTLNPLLEEFYWRGFVQPRVGLLPTSALFGAMHFPMYALFLGPVGGAALCVCPALLGWLWGTLAIRYRTLWPPVVVHFAVNVAMFVAASGARS